MPETNKLAAVGLVVLFAGALAVAGFALGPPGADDGTDEPADWRTEGATVETFDSEAQFRDYLGSTQAQSGVTFAGGVSGNADVVREDATTGADDAASSDGAAGGASGGESASGGADRHADTNVQVEGIDEPDVLKTDGRSVFYAGNRYGRYVDTRVLDAAEPADPEIVSGVPETGQLLLANDTLVVLQGDELHGFDVSDRENPERVWTKSLDGRLETARLKGGDVYLVVAEHTDRENPCPVEPLGAGDDAADAARVACSDVHYSPDASGADTTYSVVRIDPADGEIEDTASFVGSAGHTVTYVSANAVYLTYPDSASRAEMRMEFLLGPGSDVLDERAVADLEQLREYDLSERARLAEIEAILSEWRARLDEDERGDAREELEDAFETYSEEHLREFQSTGIVRVDTNGSLDVSATGKVPGRPLDQFSLSEHEGHLRIATTVEAPAAESENDLYVLDGELDVVGEVQGMGVDQRIYSVRYVGDEAYLVTYRQIDPFYTVDLSDPEDPEIMGELKLPGFSTYLHPLSEDRVLGIGQQDGEVKAVTFDISDRSNPTVEDDAILDARWSAISETHHAFLLDERHGVFFLPTENGGYVYDYEDGLTREMVVETDGPAVRATYLDDYLYVFGQQELVVVDETTWEEERRVDL
ncbi:beta-propeller domain-containing protein [Natronoarchaeum rubrum]|uniref:beta-propeller domain-containing protein n=1 Tax=Natronoarchaeum rubrum TaxID=755311 RepID=UPI002112B9EC|nr:beta-propeller domain-containing protein [Natronoarchaeum rubrum]